MRVREAKKSDVPEIVDLAFGFEDKLMPYIYDEEAVRSYIESFWLAELKYKLQGAIHCAYPDNVHDLAFLEDTKLVPEDIITDFSKKKGDIFLCHIICPGKGSFGHIVRHLKAVSDSLHCFLSVKSAAFPSYERHDFKFGYPIQIWNHYKEDFSTFRYGVWRGD